MAELYPNPKSITFTSPEPTDSYLQYWGSEMRILDLGCGYGRVLEYLRKKGFKNLYGVDSSPTLIERAKVNQITLPENLFASDILEFASPFQMDVVLMMGVIEYFVSEESRIQLSQLLTEIISPGGFFYLATFLRSRYYLKNYAISRASGRRWGTITTKSGITLYHATESELDKLVEPHFSPIRKELRSFTTWSGKQTPGYIVLYKKEK
jgi:SAM-dependent methyltransferase